MRFALPFGFAYERNAERVAYAFVAFSSDFDRKRKVFAFADFIRFHRLNPKRIRSVCHRVCFAWIRPCFIDHVGVALTVFKRDRTIDKRLERRAVENAP